MMWYWLLVLCCLQLTSDAYRNSRSTSGGLSHFQLGLNNEGNRRIIRPDDINKLFDMNVGGNKEVTEDNEAIYDEEMEEDEIPRQEKQVADSSNVLQELNALNDMIESNNDSYDDSDEDSMNKNNEYNGYTDLGTRVVDIKVRNTIINDVSLKSSATSVSKKAFPIQSSSNIDGELLAQSSPRITKYIPAPSVRGDPMQYGAYRRTQIVVEKDKKGKNKTNKGKNIIKKGKTTGERDNFYDAIKKLGSGPKDSGSSTTTGVAEPKGNMKPVVPNKPIPKKNKKRIITPDDINNLFSNDKKVENVNKNNEEDEDEDYEEEVEEEEEEEIISDDMASKLGLSGADKDYYKSMVASNEEIPKWIMDAEKEVKAELSKKNKKKKKITDDWRFWLSIIAGVGFVTAFYSVFQQTGGGASFPVGIENNGFTMPTFNAGPSNDELII